MKRYFFVLNWLLLLTVLGVHFWLAPLIGTIYVTPLAVMAAMLTAGFPSWEYFRSQSADKDWKWRKAYFQKDYGLEIFVWFILVVLSFLAGCILWHVLYVFVGFSLVWLVNILFECLWAKIHGYGRKSAK